MSIQSLPWDDDGAAVTTSGTDMHARATSLARAAMNAAAGSTFDPSDTDYGREKARYAAALATIRSENAQRHVAANNARAEAARAAAAERQAAHQARNEAARLDKQARKLAKAA